MKAPLSIALVLSAALLSACGSSSSDEEPDPSGPIPIEASFEKFDLSAYEAKTINAETLAGTWVKLTSVEWVEGNSDGIEPQTSQIKEYSIIRSTDTGYEKSISEGFFGAVTVDGSDVTFEYGGVGTIIDNNHIYGTREDESEVFTMVKISNDEISFGTANYTFNEEGITKNVFCFLQEKTNHLINSDSDFNDDNSFSLEVGFEDGLSGDDLIGIYAWNDEGAELNDYSELQINVEETRFLTPQGDTANFSMDVETSFSNTMTFSGMGDSSSVSGTIQIQLPLQ
ncbi:MAG: hypothetical protein V7785_21530 [Bermanella sp.]